MVKHLFHIIDNPVWALKEESHLNSISMLSDCVGERLTLGFFLRYVSCRLVIVFSFCCRVLLWRVLTEKCSVGEFYSLLVVDWLVAGLWLQRGFPLEKTIGLGSVGEPVRKCDFGKSRLTKASDQTKLRVLALSNVSMSV